MSISAGMFRTPEVNQITPKALPVSLVYTVNLANLFYSSEQSEISKLGLAGKRALGMLTAERMDTEAAESFLQELENAAGLENFQQRNPAAFALVDKLSLLVNGRSILTPKPFQPNLYVPKPGQSSFGA